MAGADGHILAIVGRDPAPSVLALARHSWVEVIGTVPDMRPWLRRCRAYACPMISGTGIKNKLLEAMAVGSACVVTPLALRGTTAAPGRDVLVAARADGLADALLTVLADRGEAERLGASARAYVEANHSWSAVAARFERLHAPIGLDIGAETPEEIAVAIVAELIQARAARRPKK